MYHLPHARASSVTFFFFFNDTATTEIYTLSLHDALPISARRGRPSLRSRGAVNWTGNAGRRRRRPNPDRKSTRLNSSHLVISYAVFCLKKKTRPQLAARRVHSSVPLPKGLQADRRLHLPY